MKRVCMVCGRIKITKEEKRSLDELKQDAEVSHSLCARCEIATSDYYELSTEEGLISIIKKENNEGIVWKGEDNSNFSEADLEIYNSLRSRAEAELLTEKRLYRR